MHIIYAITGCSDGTYRRLFAEQEKKPSFQAQKYHRLVIEGLAVRCRVDVVANPPINRTLLQERMVRLPKEFDGGAYYQYICAYRNPVRKLLHVLFGTFVRTFRLADRDAVVVVDCLNRTASFAALLAARLRRRPCVGIVTDLPDMFQCGQFSKSFANFVIRHCTHHVLLTEEMHHYLAEKLRADKPYVVLEGHSDITMEARQPSLEKKYQPRMCLYAGSVLRKYGMIELLEGFCQADIPDVELHIYGSGDCQEEVCRAAEHNPRIRYGGMLFSDEVVEKELEATVLINPRPLREEFVKYSFPSKTMEYMASGTPVLTTRLPGIPQEYAPYLYFIEHDTAQGVAEALKQVFSHSQEELFQKGLSAREYILKQRNNVVQAEKVIAMLEKTGVHG